MLQIDPYKKREKETEIEKGRENEREAHSYENDVAYSTRIQGFKAIANKYL